MKRKIFIGSSTEGYVIAEQIRDEINTELGDWIECETWKDGKVFSHNKSTLECLVKASRKYDYGIMVASNDDISLKRLQMYRSMRDNVLFEMGLFLGSLGLQRAFLITHDKIGLPSDYNGVTVVKYGKKNLQHKIQEIISEIKKTEKSYNLKPLPSAALAFGYFENFILKFAKKHYEAEPEFKLKIIIPQNITDIDAQITKYKHENPSNHTNEERPVVYKYIDCESYYWDIPTTLQTINNLIDYFVPPVEFGINVEKEEWIKHELRNFKGTLDVLIVKQNVYKNNFEVIYI
ncbi:MAG: nucleotide-binding protein [Paludibacter sp.]|nr:nucleotide-binding protein [Paludibacter sp.]